MTSVILSVHRTTVLSPDEKEIFMASTLNELEQHLWGAANISSEAVSIVANIRATSLAADADEHRFDLPKGHRWEDVRKHTTNIGEYLNSEFQAVEDANMTSWSQSKVTESLWSGKKSEHMGYLSDEPLFA